MRIARAQVFRYTLGLRQPLPLRRGAIAARSGFLLKLVDEDGRAGWGEAAPLPGFSSETADAAEAVLATLPGRLAGYRLPARYEDLEGAGLVHTPQSMAVAFAVESAYLNLMARRAGLPLHRYLRAAAPGTVLSNALLAGTDEAVRRRAADLAAQGYTAAKIKVGRRPPAEEAALVQAVRAAVGPSMALRLDANRQWDLETAVEFGRAVQGCGIEYIEEPVREPLEMPLFFERARVPYALDETLPGCFRELRARLGPGRDDTPELRRFVHELHVLFSLAGACIWKPSLLYDANLGGVLAGRRFAFPINRLVLTGAFESGVGTAIVACHAAAYAAEAPAGLDTYAWLAEDVLEQRLPFDGPRADLEAIDAAAQRVDESRLTLLYA